MQHPCAIQQSLDNIFAASKVRLFLWHKFTASLQELDWQQSSLVEYQATDIYIYIYDVLPAYLYSGSKHKVLCRTLHSPKKHSSRAQDMRTRNLAKLMVQRMCLNKVS